MRLSACAERLGLVKLLAAFDARFRFACDANNLCVVTMPKGWRPLAFTGRGGCTLCFAETASEDIRHRLKNHTVAWVSFDEWELGSVIRWNADRSEAWVSIRVWYGPLAATGYVVQVRKIGGEWVPVLCSMSWIS